MLSFDVRPTAGQGLALGGRVSLSFHTNRKTPWFQGFFHVMCHMLLLSWGDPVE